MHKFCPTPREHFVVNAFGISVAFAKHSTLFSRLHFKKPGFRRYITFIAIIAVEMVWREVNKRSGIAGEAVRNINLVA